VTLHLNIPEDIAKHLSGGVTEISRAALELMIAEAYREQKLSADEVRRALCYATRIEVDRFLKERGIWLEYTMEDFDHESATIREVRRRHSQSSRRPREQRDNQAG
jgi:uncharacterized protein UPF0175